VQAYIRAYLWLADSVRAKSKAGKDDSFQLGLYHRAFSIGTFININYLTLCPTLTFHISVCGSGRPP
jgi:hypothetical protein